MPRTNAINAVLTIRQRRQKWHQIVTALMAVVVFCTTYALILPAITASNTTYCGLEEHSHTDACYALGAGAGAGAQDGEGAADAQPTCGLEEHTHTEDCFTAPESFQFTFENGNVKGTVTVPFSDALPLDLSCTVVQITADTDAATYAAATEAGAATVGTDSQMLTAAQLYRLEWQSAGAAYTLPAGVQPTVTLDVSGVETGSEETLTGAVLQEVAGAGAGADEDAGAGAQDGEGTAEDAGVSLLSEDAAIEGVAADDEGTSDAPDDATEDTTAAATEDAFATATTAAAPTYTAASTADATDAGLITLTLTSADAPIMLMSSAGTTTTSGHYYKRIDSIAELDSLLTSKNYSDAKFALVFTNNVTLFCADTSADKWYAGAIEVNPVKGYENEGYAILRYVYSNTSSYTGYTGSSDATQVICPSTYPYRHWSISKGYWNYWGTWIDFGSRYYFCLNKNKDLELWAYGAGDTGSSDDIYSISSSWYINLNHDDDSNVWRIRCENESNSDGAYIAYDENGGHSTDVFQLKDTNYLSQANMQIYYYVGGSLEIPNDITAADAIESSALEQWDTPEYSAYTQASTSQTGEEEATTLTSDATMTYASDASTSDIESELGSNGDYSNLAGKKLNEAQQENDGRILTDKSVIYGKDDYGATNVSGYGSTASASGYDEGDFSVTLSALGQEWLDTGSETTTAPIDVVYIFDVSSSMESELDDGTSRWKAAMDSINASMKDVLDRNPLNRVGLVAYSNASEQIMQLDRYTADNGKFLVETSDTFEVSRPSYVYDGSTISASTTTKSSHIQTSSSLEYEGTSQTGAIHAAGSVEQKTFNFSGAWDSANTQEAIQDAYDLYLNMSDQSSGSYEYNEYLTYEINGQRQARQPVIVLVTDGTPTLCTFNYMYPKDGPLYGMGFNNAYEGYGVVGYYTILSATYFKNLTGILYNRHAMFYTLGIGCTTDYAKAVLNPTKDMVNACNGGSADTEQQLYNLLAGKIGGTLTQAVKIPLGSNGKTYTDYFTSIAGAGITSSVIRGVYNPYISANYSYCDKAWLDDLSGDEMAAALGEVLNTVQLTYDYGFMLKDGTSVEFDDAIGTGMTVKGAPVLRYYGQNFAPTSSKVTDNGWVKYTTYKYEVKVNRQASDAKGSAITDTVGPEVDLSGIVVEVWEFPNSDSGSVYFKIPADLVPTYYPDLYKSFYYEELPVRLIYRVGLSSKALSSLASGVNGSVSYYVGSVNDEDYDEPVSDTTVSFWPDSSNPYYYDSDGNAKGETVEISKASVSASGNVSGTASYVVSQYQNVPIVSEVESVTVGDIGKVTRRLGNSGVLTFSAANSITVAKEWPNGEPSDVGYVLVDVYRGARLKGSEVPASYSIYQSLLLGADNNWKSTFTAPLSDDNYEYTYFVFENNVDGYTASYYDSSGNQLSAQTISIYQEPLHLEGSFMELDPMLVEYDVYPAAVNGTVTIRNMSYYSLPESGGVGEGVPAAAGCTLVMAAFAGLLLTTRRHPRPR